MAEQGKKVEVRFGAFTCSIEGYDNPVEQMREILGMMQRMITETPALAEADPKFDASRLEDAIANEDPDSPTPGIVVIRNSDSAASADPEPAQDDGPVDEAETIAEDPHVEPAEAEAEEVEAPSEDAVEETTSAFPLTVGEPAETEPEETASSFSGSFDEPDQDSSELDPSQAPGFETQSASATGQPADSVYPDIAADIAAAASATNAGASMDDWAEPSYEATPSATPLDPAEQDLTTALEDTVASADAQDDADLAAHSGAPVEDADEVNYRDEALAQVSVPAEPKQRLADRIRNIFAAPEPEARPNPVNIFASPDPAPAPAPPPHPEQVNIFASPGAGAASAVRHETAALFDTPEPQAPAYHDPLRSPEPAPEAPVQEQAPAAFDAPADEAPREYARSSAGLADEIRSIFAPPPGTAKPDAIKSIFAPPPSGDPAQGAVDTAPETESAAPEPEPQLETRNAAPEPEEHTQSRFQAMLSRVHGASPVAAPGTAPADEPVSQGSEQTEDATAQDLAEQAGDPSVAGQLEAAAAWLTLVQGKSRFSRREVMSVLETIPTEQSRALADRIKGFGKLVRSGTLVLVDDGVFALTQTGRDRFQAMLDQR